MGLLDRFRRTSYVALPRGDGDVVEGEVGYIDPDAALNAALTFGMEGDRETNPDLVGHNRYVRYEAMRFGDPKVEASLGAVVKSIVQAPWKIEATGDSPEAKAVAEFVDLNLGIDQDPEDGDGWLDGTWPDVLTMALDCLTYGSMTYEIVWGDPVTWTDSEGDDHLVRPIARLSPRYPYTIEEYLAPRPGARGPVGGVRQVGQRQPIPGEKVVHHVVNRWGGRYTGVSMLRPAYTYWKLKQRVVVSAAIAFDRYAAGIPVVRHPNNRAAKSTAAEIGRSLAHHERAYVTFPGPPPGPDQEGWGLELVSGADTLADPTPLVQMYDDQIITAFHAGFLGLGTSDSGSRGVGEVIADPFYRALNYIADMIAADLTSQLVRTLVRVNFGPTVPVPRVCHGKLAYQELEVLGRFLADASSAGISTSHRELQEAVLERANLPAPPEDEALPNEGTGDPAAPPATDAVIAGDQEDGGGQDGPAQDATGGGDPVPVP